jgi:hypothetical protein
LVDLTDLIIDYAHDQVVVVATLAQLEYDGRSGEVVVIDCLDVVYLVHHLIQLLVHLSRLC